MGIIKFEEGDILEMKKCHPCGSKRFVVLRGGSDVRLRCTLCSHDVTLPRIKAEKAIKKIVGKEQ